VRSGRIAHAYLFTGPRGVGKTTIARILARALNCSAGETDEPCGTCESCKEVAVGKSLDVIEIDGASNRRIEDMRNIRETVQYAPLSGRRKIYIIDEAHMLTREAFNALLKTLEEPPEHVVFVLATTEPGKIPETITSRCQRFDFHRISETDSEERLEMIVRDEGISVEDGALRLIAARADGSMRDAESLLDQLLSLGADTVTVDDVERVLGIPDVEVYFAITDAAASSDSGAALAALAEAMASGFDPRDLMDGLVEHVANLLMMRAVSEPARLVGRAAEYDARTGASRELDENDLVRMSRIALDAQAAVRWSSQAALLVELAVVRMAKLERTVTIEDVLRALSAEGSSRAPARGSSNGSASDGSKGTASSSSHVSSSADLPRGSASGEARENSGTRSGTHLKKTRGQTVSGGAAHEYRGGPELWPDVLERIRGAKPAIGAFLCEAEARSLDGNVLCVTVPNGSGFHRDQLSDRGNMTVMEREASAVYGGPIRLGFDFVAPTTPRTGSEAVAGATGSDGGASGAGASGEGQAIAGGNDDVAVLDRVLEMFDGEVDETR
ncbi:DNA polymerase III subunit gamma/tau, partial [bacterium]|nr:DNA polymerase III subunit gamma/tau [bacterium]